MKTEEHRAHNQLRELGSRIQRLRADRRWSQRQLSRETGIDSSRLSRIERGLVSPSLAELDRLRDSLHTTYDALLFGEPAALESGPDPFVRRAVHLLQLGLAAERSGMGEQYP